MTRPPRGGILARKMVAPAPTLAPPTAGRWLGMWIQPRATMRRILDAGGGGAFPLSALLGVSQALDQAANHDAGARAGVAAILASCTAAGAVGGPAVVWASAWLVRWTGSWLGGAASARDVRAALAWGQVPAISALPLWIPVLLAGGGDVFRTQVELADPSAAATVLVCGLAMAAAALWGAVTSVLAVAEAHRFSAGKALASAALGLLLVAGPVAAAVAVWKIAFAAP
jgi:hypothetical protein